MELLARRITERNGDYAEITGGRDIGRILRIPDEIEGLPVCSVAGHAFERNQMIEEVILPDSLEKLGRKAFDLTYSESSSASAETLSVKSTW